MKKTRKIFLLDGYTPEEEKILLQQLCFKALTVFHSKEVTLNELVDVFKHNKNALCISCTLPGRFTDKAIKCNDLKIDDNLIYQFQNIADINNCDIGDHKSNSSGLDGIPTANDCEYCKYLKGNKEVFQHKTLYASSNFFVVSTLGQFINGYLLIIPYRHIMSNAELSAPLREEFLTVLEDISYILKLTYDVPNVLIWENGTGNSGIGKAKNSVVHAHTHIAPSSLNAKAIDYVSGFPFKQITFNSIGDYDKDSYLLIKGAGSTWKICQNPKLYIPRQYIRQLLAEEYNVSGEAWNWRTHPFVDNKVKTDEQILSTLRKHWQQLPERIKDRTRDHLI